MPETFTYTEVRTRTEAVTDQVRMFLQYAGVKSDDVEKLVSAVEAKWLKAVGVFLTDKNGERIYEAEVSIDWVAHSRYVRLSPTIRTDLPGWENGASPEIRTIGHRFGKKAREIGQDPRFCVRFTPEITADENRHKSLCAIVGVSFSSPMPRWASAPTERSYSVLDLSEVNVALREG